MRRIRVIRISQSMTIWALSQAASISQGRLSMLERGLIEPTAQERERLAQILHAPASSLFRLACRSRQAAAVPVCTE